MSQKTLEEPLYTEIYRKNAVAQIGPKNLGAHFVRACAVETHVKISQEPFYTEIYRKKPQPRVSTLIKHRPLHLPEERLSAVTLFGEKHRFLPAVRHNNSPLL